MRGRTTASRCTPYARRPMSSGFLVQSRFEQSSCYSLNLLCVFICFYVNVVIFVPKLFLCICVLILLFYLSVFCNDLIFCSCKSLTNLSSVFFVYEYWGLIGPSCCFFGCVVKGDFKIICYLICICFYYFSKHKIYLIFIANYIYRINVYQDVFLASNNLETNYIWLFLLILCTVYFYKNILFFSLLCNTKYVDALFCSNLNLCYND